MKQHQVIHAAGFALRKAAGQTRSLLYVEGPSVTVPINAYKSKIIVNAIRSWTVDAYRKPTKKESDKNVNLADHDAVFVWQAFDRFGIQAELPVRDAFFVDGARGETWRITHVKPIETLDALYIVTCKPQPNFELSVPSESEATAAIGVSAAISFSFADLIYIRPPVQPVSINLDYDWQTIPFSVFGPPLALNGDLRTACISSVQAVGASCIEFELQRSVEPEGIQIWERVESGLAQVNGWGYCRMVWNDEPPWIALGNLLRYRVRARLVSGYARIFSPEFTVKVEMIVQRTQGCMATSFAEADLSSGRFMIFQPPPGRYMLDIDLDIYQPFGCQFSIGTISDATAYSSLIMADKDYTIMIRKVTNGDAIYLTVNGPVNAGGSGKATITFF